MHPAPQTLMGTVTPMRGKLDVALMRRERPENIPIYFLREPAAHNGRGLVPLSLTRPVPDLPLAHSALQSRNASSMAAWILRLETASPIRCSSNPSSRSRGCGAALTKASRSLTPQFEDHPRNCV